MQAALLAGMGPELSSWRGLYGGAAEGAAYYAACETAVPPAFTFFAVGVYEGSRLVAGAPGFQARFRLDTGLNGMSRRAAGLLGDVKLVGLGSPHADRCALTFARDFDRDARLQATSLMLDVLEGERRASRAQAVILKNIDRSQRADLAPAFERSGLQAIEALPVALLDVPSTDAAYIASLSANMRSNMRRKLKRASSIQVDVRDEIGDLAGTINALREETRARAETDYGVFEEVAPDYFAAVLKQMPGRALLPTYWLDETLVGFSLVLIGDDEIVEKYTGMRYPLAIDHGVFFLNWMTIVRLAAERGIKRFRAGETTYLTKARLGCRLHRSWIYARGGNAVANAGLRLARPWIGLDRSDPDLKRLGGEAPYAD